MKTIKHRQHEHGGILLYLLIPLVLVGGAAGLLFVFKDSETVKPLKESLRPTLSKFGLMAPAPTGPAVAGPVVSATAAQRYTVAELYGDPRAAVEDTLNQIQKEKHDLAMRDSQLQSDRQRALDEKKLLEEREKQLQDILDRVNASIQKQEEMDRERQAYLTSARVQKVRDLSTNILKMSPKNAASVLSTMWKNTSSPDDQDIVIEVLRSIPGNKKAPLMDALTKSDAPAAAAIMVRMVTDTANDPGVAQTPVQQ